MSPVDRGLAELVDVAQDVARDDWALALVELSAFYHLAASRACTGYAISSSGRALCSNCDWQLSGRMDDAGEERSARFVLFVLAAIGEAIATWVTASKLSVEEQLRIAESIG